MAEEKQEFDPYEHERLTPEEVQELFKAQNEAIQEAQDYLFSLIEKSDQERVTFEEVQRVLYGIGCNSENRLSKFIEISDYLDSDVYYRGLALAYTLSDNLYEYRQTLKDLFSYHSHWDRELLMTEAEQQALAALPDTVTIYRGMTKEEAESGAYGVSWTLSKPVAEFFRDTYGRNFDTAHLEKTVVELKVPKAEIVALFLEREEQEVIYLGNTGE